jgi:hypothetical protein
MQSGINLPTFQRCLLPPLSGNDRGSKQVYKFMWEFFVGPVLKIIIMAVVRNLMFYSTSFKLLLNCESDMNHIILASPSV